MGKYEKLKGKRNYRIEQVDDNMKVYGKYINELVSGYRQLSVSGRGLMSNTLDTEDVLGRPGKYVKSYKYDERVMTIKYMLTAVSSRDLRVKYNKLNGILSGELEVEFDDEPGIVYKKVYLTGAENRSETSLSIVSEFTLTATDPYKYGEIKEESKVVLSNADFVDVERIKTKFTKKAVEPILTVYSGKQTYSVSYGGTFNVGAITTLDFTGGEFSSYTTNNGDNVTTVSYGRLPRTIVVVNGSRGSIIAEGSSGDERVGEVTIEYRDRSL